MKVAIVTGASRGIGAATALRLGADGYAVAVHYHTNADKAAEVVGAIIKAGGKAIAVQADMGVESDVVGLFAQVDKALGPVTALVNNAAAQCAGPVEEVTLATLEATFSVNVFGTIIACREAMRRMKEGNAIVNVSSESARFGGNKMSVYAASKAAIATFTIGFAREAAQRGIRVNTISPGVIDTDAHAGATPERLKILNASIPLGRMGRSDEAAAAIAWLLSEDASYVSGAVLPVTGAR